jgi:Fur family peroxide stress response transcriptional regulator
MNRRTRDDMLVELKKSGHRVTRQRIAVIDYLAGREDHPSARNVYRGVAEVLPGVSLATIYNTLSTLVNAGLIRELDFEDTDNRYDTNLEHHLNLVCISCGEILDLPQTPPISVEEIRSRLGFETVDMRFECRGICRSCGAREAGISPARGKATS